jgi:hypothetical protein
MRSLNLRHGEKPAHTEAKEVVLGLAKAGKEGAECLVRLLEKNKLGNLDLGDQESKEVVRDLAEADENGADCLRRLFEQDKLKNLKLNGVEGPENVKKKALKLLEEGPNNSCLDRRFSQITLPVLGFGFSFFFPRTFSFFVSF